MSFQIKTERLILRDYRPSDLDDVISMISAPEFQRFYSEQDCTAEHWKMLVDMFIDEAKQVPRQKFNLAIQLKENSQFIGAVGIRLDQPDDPNNRQASVGCSLHPNHQQQGIAEEAMRAIIDCGFNTLGVHRIYADTISENSAAIALCQKLGFRQEAELVEHRYFKNRWWNTAVFALLKRELIRAEGP